MAEDLDVPLRGIQQAKQQLDGGGFARAIRAEQAEDLSAPDFKIHVVHRARLGTVPEILEHLRQPAHGDDDLGAGLRIVAPKGSGGDRESKRLNSSHLSNSYSLLF